MLMLSAKDALVTVACLGTVMKRWLIANSTSNSRSNFEPWESLETDDVVPFVFVADNTFSLTNEIQILIQIKVSQKKDTVFKMCVFQIPFITLSSRYRKWIWHNGKCIQSFSKKIALAAVLHNMLQTRCCHIYTHPGYETDEDSTVKSTWRKEINTSVF